MSNNSAANKKVARNSVFMAIRMVIVMGITFYTTRVTLNVLGVEDYGIYNVVCGFVSMFTFLNTSISNGIQRFYNFELGTTGPEGANRVYCTSVLIQTILAIVIVLVAELFGVWYIENKIVLDAERLTAAHWIFQSSLFSFLFVFFGAPYAAAIMAHEDMDFTAFVSVLNSALRLIIVFIVPVLCIDQLITYGLLMALVEVICFACNYIYANRHYKEIVFNFTYDKIMFKSMLSFSGWNVFGTFGNIIKEQGVNLIMNLFFGPVVNAARGIASQVAGGLQNFVGNLTVPVRPQVTQSYAQGDYRRTLNLTYSVSKLSCCFLFLISLPILVELDYLLGLWLGTNVPDHTSSFIVIIVINAFVNNLNAATSGIVHSSGKMKSYQLSGCVINLISLPLAYMILYFGYSAEWALIMTLAISILGQYVAIHITKRIIAFSFIDYCTEILFPFLKIVPIPIVAAIMIVNSFEQGFFRLILNAIVTTTISTGIIYKIALKDGERDLIKSVIRSIIRK